MTKKQISVRELASYLLDLIENGHGDKIVKLSVEWDNCDHIQDLHEIYCFDGVDWVTLTGKVDL